MAVMQPHPPIPWPWLSAPEAAEKLGVVHRTVIKYCNLGYLEAIKTPLGWHIRAAGVATFEPPKDGRPPKAKRR